ncbi:MAG: cyclase family protein [Planctomycetes bacterium]|nr:cyclase family protein [Planctomycetota bacterium]
MSSPGQTIQFNKIVDLSHPLAPGKEPRKLEARQIFADEVAPVRRLPDQWYIMHELALVNHLGTHLEVPYHLLKTGFDLAGLPVERMVRAAAVLEILNLPPGRAITCQEAMAAAELAGGVQDGDMVFIHTGWDRAYGTAEYLRSPCLEVGALDWLAAQGMSLIGIDSAGVENLKSTEHECHLALFTRGIPLIENLAHLDRLEGHHRITAIVAPVAIRGVEAIPVRVLALI